ncbi:MAG: DJ-1/PfpI family protein [Bacillales bacterium]|nr:DJ-1/PfpI family protein [Bacillales bacterium]
MKHLMIVGDYFEDVECIATLDILVRGNDEVKLVSMMKRKEVITKCGYKILVDDIIENVNISEFDSLIIPGGPGSFKILAYIPLVDQLIDIFAKNNKLVAAICAAPMLVGRRGYYQNKSYTVYPGFEGFIVGGEYKKDQGVIVQDNFISAKSMYYSIPFGLAIHQYFHGKESAKLLEKTCQGE